MQLAPTRATRTGPFDVVGLDIAGLLGMETQVCRHFLICGCAATRSLRIEIIQNVSTTTFLVALQRFVARHGTSNIVYSDSAKAFQRSGEELRGPPNILGTNAAKERAADWRLEPGYNVP